jgi:sporulation protein YlmC with PRC-barrel domain
MLIGEVLGHKIEMKWSIAYKMYVVTLDGELVGTVSEQDLTSLIVEAEKEDAEAKRKAKSSQTYFIEENEEAAKK